MHQTLSLIVRLFSRLSLGLCLLAPLPLAAQQQIDEDELGAWYMYMWNTSLEDSRVGFQGDIQHRNWDLGGDLEQLLIRGGLTWTPEGGDIQYTGGYAHITSGAYGSSSDTSEEHRIYQEALLPARLGEKIFLTHRWRLEQRWVENQDFRARLRYSLGLNYPLNQDTLDKGAIYLSLYNELFLNLNRDIGDGRRVDYFDRNRAYAAVGYSATDNIRLQFGYMFQETDDVGKGQLQFNLIHRF